jgi:Spore coat polysaccharide biosynthesis protein F, CMP-KDO synthetase homolog
MNSIVILQARTNSSRLPAKVLLPIGGIPIVVLAAKRAANTGKTVIVATSTESSDDGLVNILKANGLAFFRGDLNNTLKRFVDALVEMKDQTIVFRLTADNIFPDGKLLDEIEQDFINRGLDYLCCNGENSGLPYGTSVEVTYTKHLRNALDNTHIPHDLEHVTPYIIRKFGLTYFEKYQTLKKGLYRSTIDTFEDYLNIQKVFSNVENPILVDLHLLIEELAKSNKLLTSCSLQRLVIGGAQLGLNYGINNTRGQPSEKESSELLQTAIHNNILYIDTANAYGNSEQVIGNSLSKGWQSCVKVITKLSPLTDCPTDANQLVINAFVDASIYQSCRNLNRSFLDVLMLHRAGHLDEWHGFVWHRLQMLQNEGLIENLGVSVQSPAELDRVLDEPKVRFIQMPYNILDWRWDSCIEKLKRIKSERDVSVHIRSTLLQGLLITKTHEHWRKANVKNSQSVVDWLENITIKYNRLNVIDLCLAYIRTQNWVDGVVVGMETKEQLIENIKYFNEPLLNNDELNQIINSRPFLSEKTLNPSLWQKSN